METETSVGAVTGSEAVATQLCKTCLTVGRSTEQATQPLTSFSVLLSGLISPVCKTCRIEASRVWTTTRADYRKEYQDARMLQSRGYNVVVPQAKTWVSGSPLLLIDGRDAREVYAADKAAKQAAHQAELTEAQQAAQAVRDEQKAAKAELRAANLQTAIEANLARKAEREAIRAAKLAVSAELAQTALAAKEATKAAKNAERAAAIEAANLARETRKSEKAALRAAKIQAAEVARILKQEARANKIQAALTASTAGSVPVIPEPEVETVMAQAAIADEPSVAELTVELDSEVPAEVVAKPKRNRKKAAK